MKLSFFTPPQGMAFVDPATHQLANAWQLQPGVIYDVFAVVKNEDAVEYPNVQINVVHSPFGIGIPGGTSYIVQPAPINVPPALNANQPGLATFQFQFMAPPAGHGCLTATIILTNAKLNQNTTVLAASPAIASTISFLVFGNPNFDEVMVLKVTQTLENGTPVAAADNWPHQFVVPPVLNPTNQSADSVTLHLARGNAYFSIGINVTIPPTANAPHIFFVQGLVNGADVGSVSILLKPDITFVKPAPYVTGGFESPDIVLIDPQGNVVPVLGNPIDDTILRPNTDYTMAVFLHNSSPTPAVNTVVRFWENPGGIGGQAVLLDVQTVTIPGNGFIEVISRRKFHSGPPGAHRCAIVSVFNSQSDICKTDYATFDELVATVGQMHPGDPEAMAWRNTDSRVAILGELWRLELVATRPRIPLPDPGPVEIEVEGVLVPHDWQTLPEAADAVKTLGAAGLQTRFPAFLLPKLRNMFKKVELDVEVKAEDARVEALELAAAAAQTFGAKGVVIPTTPNKQFNLHARGEKQVPITITGKLPREAQDGDTVLVKCLAKYPTKEGKALPIEFTEALHVVRR